MDILRSQFRLEWSDAVTTTWPSISAKPENEGGGIELLDGLLKTCLFINRSSSLTIGGVMATASSGTKTACMSVRMKADFLRGCDSPGVVLASLFLIAAAVCWACLTIDGLAGLGGGGGGGGRGLAVVEAAFCFSFCF